MHEGGVRSGREGAPAHYSTPAACRILLSHTRKPAVKAYGRLPPWKFWRFTCPRQSTHHTTGGAGACPTRGRRHFCRSGGLDQPVHCSSLLLFSVSPPLDAALRSPKFLDRRASRQRESRREPRASLLLRRLAAREAQAAATPPRSSHRRALPATVLCRERIPEPEPRLSKSERRRSRTHRGAPARPVPPHACCAG